jgi:hypothetical protein
MIVDQNDCRCSLGDRFPENFSRMYERRIEKPASYGDVPFQPVLGIEYGDVKFFDRQIFQPLRENLEDVARPSNGSSFLSFFGRHASSQLESGVDTNSTSRSHSANAGEGRDWLGCQKPERSAAGRKYFLADPKRGSAFRSTT